MARPFVDEATWGVPHRTQAELEAGLAAIRASPASDGRLELIVSRPSPGQRQIVEEGRLDLGDGLVGDSWSYRPGPGPQRGAPEPDRQLTLINARVAVLIGGDPEGGAQSGDQLHLDLDLSEANLPAGTRLHLGAAVIEVTEEPHTGCAKFTERFGVDALRFVNSPIGRELHLRGVNARVIVPGTIRRGDTVRVERPA
ncbi:MAG TPA: MOSC domain-containing protein [Acidimicrobiales bacterium]|nr:MOSC domain-containing protein [Acidimicrobiales bacterium]